MTALSPDALWRMKKRTMSEKFIKYLIAGILLVFLIYGIIVLRYPSERRNPALRTGLSYDTEGVVFELGPEEEPGYIYEGDEELQAPPPEEPEEKLQASEFLGKSTAEILSIMGPLLRKEQERTGILASVSHAQFLCESGYGQDELVQKANNCFGMKCMLSNNDFPNSVWDGSSRYRLKTREEMADGGSKYIYADFRSYASVEDSIADHSSYLLGAKAGSSKRYKGIGNEKDYRRAARIIQQGGYATASSYAEVLCGIIEKYGLTQFDL